MTRFALKTVSMGLILVCISPLSCGVKPAAFGGDVSEDSSSDSYSDSETESQTGEDSESDFSTDTDSVPYEDTDTTTTQDTETASGQDSDSDSDEGTPTEPDTASDTESGEDTGSETEADSETIADTGTEADSETIADTGTEADSETIADTGTEGGNSYIDGSELKLELDESFAEGGEFVYSSPLGEDRARDAVVTPDGSIFITGYMSNGPNVDLLLMKLTSNGTLDPSFNGNGFIIRHSIAGGNGFDAGETIQLAPDGDLLVSGVSQGPGGYRLGVLWKVSPGGIDDATFGNAGTYLLDVSVGQEYFLAEYDPITANIFAVCPISGQTHAYRIKADGSGLDDSFGSGGSLELFPKSSIQPVLHSLSDGSLLVAGACSAKGTTWDACAWHISTEGKLMVDFTNYKKQTLAHNELAGGAGDDYWKAVIPYPSPGGDRVILAGSSMSKDHHEDEVVARVNLSDGSLDTSFGGGDGFWTEDVLGLGKLGRVRDAVVKQDGYIVAALEFFSADGDFDVGLIKLDESGTRNMTTASGNGVLVLGEDYEERRPKLVELPDGRLLVMSSKFHETGADIVLWVVE